jgi:hypothetical protein
VKLGLSKTLFKIYFQFYFFISSVGYMKEFFFSPALYVSLAAPWARIWRTRLTAEQFGLKGRQYTTTNMHLYFALQVPRFLLRDMFFY